MPDVPKLEAAINHVIRTAGGKGLNLVRLSLIIAAAEAEALEFRIPPLTEAEFVKCEDGVRIKGLGAILSGMEGRGLLERAVDPDAGRRGYNSARKPDLSLLPKEGVKLLDDYAKLFCGNFTQEEAVGAFKNHDTWHFTKMGDRIWVRGYFVSFIPGHSHDNIRKALNKARAGEIEYDRC